MPKLCGDGGATPRETRVLNTHTHTLVGVAAGRGHWERATAAAAVWSTARTFFIHLFILRLITIGCCVYYCHRGLLWRWCLRKVAAAAATVAEVYTFGTKHLISLCNDRPFLWCVSPARMHCKPEKLEMFPPHCSRNVRAFHIEIKLWNVDSAIVC